MRLIITSIVLTILTLLGLALNGYILKKRKKAKHPYFLMLCAPLWFLIIIGGCFTRVGANEVGIIYDDRYGLKNEVKYEGFQTKSVFEHISLISTTNKTIQMVSTGQTQDAVFATVNMTIVYKIKAEDAGKFYQITGMDDINTRQMESIVKEALQSSTIKMDIYTLLGANQEGSLETCRLDFVNDLSQKLAQRYYITLISASFDDIDAGSRVEEIIKSKAEAQQQIEISELQKQQAEIEAATAKIKAQGDAEAVKASAEGQAEADKTIAAGQAAAIKSLVDGYKLQFPDLTDAQIAEVFLKVMYYDTWNGELPDTFVGMSFDDLVDAIVGKLGTTTP